MKNKIKEQKGNIIK